MRHLIVALARWSAAALAALIAAALLLLGSPAPASAAAAPGPSVRVTGSATPSAAGSIAAAKAGQVVDILLSGFGARTAVLVSIGPAALPRLVTTDASGAARAAAIVPKLPTDDYLVTAASRGATASVPLHVVTQGAGSPLRWIAPVTSSPASGARTSSVAARPASTTERAASSKDVVPVSARPSITAADRRESALPVTSLVALPASATSTPVGGWVGLAALLALAVGGSFAAVAWGLRRDAEVEPLGRHAPGHAAGGTATVDQAREAAARLLDQAREVAGRAVVVARRTTADAATHLRIAATELAARAAALRAARPADDEGRPVGRHGRPAAD